MVRVYVVVSYGTSKLLVEQNPIFLPLHRKEKGERKSGGRRVARAVFPCLIMAMGTSRTNKILRARLQRECIRLLAQRCRR